METTPFGISQNMVDFLSLIIGLVIVCYYGFLIGLVMNPEPHQKRPSKKMFFLGLIPLALWLVIFFEEFSELE